MKLRSLAFVIMLFPIIVSAYDFELDGIYYNIMSTTDLTVSVTNSGINKDPWGNISGKDYSGNLTIPDKVVLSGRTLTVVDISTYAFNESNIESIILPNSIKSISCSAFEASKSLKEIKIPASVEFIGSFAFGNCSSLKKIIIEDSDSPLGIDVTNSYAGIFRLCPIEELYIGRDIDRRISLGESSWYDNNLSPFGFQEIKSENLIITIGPKVKSLCDCIFKYGKGLAIVNIPETVEYIRNSAFEGCSQLKEVNILSKLTVIPSSAFCGCESLETIILPNSIKTIQSSAFKDCSSLKSVNLGNSLSLIGVNSFKSCSSLEKITLPRSLEKIEESAFDQCSSLTSITVLSYTPPQAAENSFSTIAYWNATLVVPYGTKTLYEAMDCWKNFSNIDEDMSDIAKYHLYYCVDGEEYKSYEIEYGATITPEPNPTKEYYTFSGWSEIPETMPANDVTVTGTFTINKYKLIYQVDGEDYKTYEVEYGSSITPESAPTKEGYDFSGWSTIPATMPAENVTITGTFSLITDEDEIIIKSYGKGTYCSRYDLDFSDMENLKAFIVSGYDHKTNTIWLTRVKSVPAGTGIIVKSTPGDYKVKHVESLSVYANVLVGTAEDKKIKAVEGEMTNFVLSKGEWYRFDDEITLPKGMAYLPLPLSKFAGTRSLTEVYEDNDEGTTEIRTIEQGTVSSEHDVWFNLQGQRVQNPGKGLYIRNGKKVVIK